MTSAAADVDVGETRGHREPPRTSRSRRKSQTTSQRRTSTAGTHGRHRSAHSSGTNRSIEARRRKEQVRRRKRQHSRCTILENLINQLERQPEVESRSLFRLTCREVSYFLILFSVVLFFRSAIFQYTKGVLEQLKRGYLVPNSSLDLVMGAEKIGFVVTIIFVALFGSRSHRPLLVACGVLVLSIGAIIWPVPYFVTSTQDGLNVSYGCNISGAWVPPQPGFDAAEIPPSIYGQLCRQSKSNTSSYTDSCSACPTNTQWIPVRDGLLYVVYLGGFLMGFGTGLFLTTGILYIEEASREHSTPIQYGFLFFMSGLGEFLGSCFVWWFINYPENLTGGIVEPWTTRAWWLGMVIFSVVLFFVAWPFLFFPKWIVEPDWSVARRQARLNRLAKMLASAKRDRQRLRKKKKVPTATLR